MAFLRRPSSQTLLLIYLNCAQENCEFFSTDLPGDCWERGSGGVQSTGVSQRVRVTGRDKSQSVASPEELFKTRDLELPFFEGSLPSCSPHSAGYTRTFLHPYFPVAKIGMKKDLVNFQWSPFPIKQSAKSPRKIRSTIRCKSLQMGNLRSATFQTKVLTTPRIAHVYQIISIWVIGSSGGEGVFLFQEQEGSVWLSICAGVLQDGSRKAEESTLKMPPLTSATRGVSTLTGREKAQILPDQWGNPENSWLINEDLLVLALREGPRIFEDKINTI